MLAASKPPPSSAHCLTLTRGIAFYTSVWPPAGQLVVPGDELTHAIPRRFRRVLLQVVPGTHPARRVADDEETVEKQRSASLRALFTWANNA